MIFEQIKILTQTTQSNKSFVVVSFEEYFSLISPASLF